MATTIELDIIKQRSDKLTPSEKRELINYLSVSLSSDETDNDAETSDKSADGNVDNPSII